MTSSSPLSSQLQDQLGCLDVGLDDVNGLLDGEPNPHRIGQVEDDVARSTNSSISGQFITLSSV